MTANVRRNLAIQLVPIGGANPLKMRISNPVPFVAGAAGTTAALIGQGGAPAYAYSIITGALPTGLSLAGGTGIISGTPSVAGTFTFTAQVQDSALTTFIATFSIKVAHIVQPVQFSPPTYDAGTGSKTYQFAVSGNTGAVTWSTTTLPSWATLSASGLLTVNTSSVFPSGSATPTITATDAGTGDAYSAPVPISVVAALQYILGTVGPTNITIGTTVTFDAKAQVIPFGGQKPYLYQLVPSVNPAAPSWVSINPTTGVLTFSPPPTYAPQTIQFDYVISDIAGGSRSVVVSASFVNPNNIIQPQQSGSNVGSAGFSTKNYTGGAWNITNSAGVLTVNLPAATNSVPGYLTTADHATLQSAASSLSSFGATPNANGASLTGGVLTLQPAAAGFPGGVSIGTQSFDGAKTFTTILTVQNQITTNGANAGFIFVDRSTSRQWQWFGTSDTAGLFNGTTTLFTIDPKAQVKASNYGSAGLNLGTVTATSLAFNFQTDQFNGFTWTSGTAITSSTATLPTNPCPVFIRGVQGAVAANIVWPTTFKGAWPTTGYVANKISVFEGFYDGANVVFVGGTQNAY